MGGQVQAQQLVDPRGRVVHAAIVWAEHGATLLHRQIRQVADLAAPGAGFFAVGE
jgi:hypothetical protein